MTSLSRETKPDLYISDSGLFLLPRRNESRFQQGHKTILLLLLQSHLVLITKLVMSARIISVKHET
jgi:hypothetical protein